MVALSDTSRRAMTAYLLVMTALVGVVAGLGVFARGDGSTAWYVEGELDTAGLVIFVAAGVACLLLTRSMYRANTEEPRVGPYHPRSPTTRPRRFVPFRTPIAPRTRFAERWPDEPVDEPRLRSTRPPGWALPSTSWSARP